MDERQKIDLDNYITGHWGEDQLKNEVDGAVEECDDAVTQVMGPYDFEQDIAWSQLSFVTQENCKRQLRRQKRHKAYKLAGLVLFVVMVITLALVAMNQIP